ncbi:unnamed protein product, partial [Mesorhabditis spiculigera]
MGIIFRRVAVEAGARSADTTLTSVTTTRYFDAWHREEDDDAHLHHQGKRNSEVFDFNTRDDAKKFLLVESRLRPRRSSEKIEADVAKNEAMRFRRHSGDDDQESECGKMWSKRRHLMKFMKMSRKRDYEVSDVFSRRNGPRRSPGRQRRQRQVLDKGAADDSGETVSVADVARPRSMLMRVLELKLLRLKLTRSYRSYPSCSSRLRGKDSVDDVDVIERMLLLLLKPDVKLSKLTQVYFKVKPASSLMGVAQAHVDVEQVGREVAEAAEAREVAEAYEAVEATDSAQLHTKVSQLRAAPAGPPQAQAAVQRLPSLTLDVILNLINYYYLVTPTPTFRPPRKQRQALTTATRKFERFCCRAVKEVDDPAGDFDLWESYLRAPHRISPLADAEQQLRQAQRLPHVERYSGDSQSGADLNANPEARSRTTTSTRAAILKRQYRKGPSPQASRPERRSRRKLRNNDLGKDKSFDSPIEEVPIQKRADRTSCPPFAVEHRLRQVAGISEDGNKMEPKVDSWNATIIAGVATCIYGVSIYMARVVLLPGGKLVRKRRGLIDNIFFNLMLSSGYIFCCIGFGVVGQTHGNWIEGLLCALITLNTEAWPSNNDVNPVTISSALLKTRSLLYLWRLLAVVFGTTAGYYAGFRFYAPIPPPTTSKDYPWAIGTAAETVNAILLRTLPHVSHLVITRLCSIQSATCFTTRINSGRNRPIACAVTIVCSMGMSLLNVIFVSRHVGTLIGMPLVAVLMHAGSHSIETLLIAHLIAPMLVCATFEWFLLPVIETQGRAEQITA